VLAYFLKPSAIHSIFYVYWELSASVEVRAEQ